MFYPFIHSNPKTQFIIGTVTLLLAFMGFLSFHPQTHISQVNTIDTILNVASVEYIGQQSLAPLICQQHLMAVYVCVYMWQDFSSLYVSSSLLFQQSRNAQSQVLCSGLWLLLPFLVPAVTRPSRLTPVAELG